MKATEKLTGIILAGGRSSRLGIPKQLLKLGGKTLTEIAVEKLRDYSEEIYVITNFPEEINIPGATAISDIQTGLGPLGGILTGLTYSQTRINFVLSCDTPFISREIIELLTDHRSTKNTVIPKAAGRLQPLCGIYTKDCMAVIEKMIAKANPLSAGIRNKALSTRALIDRAGSETIALALGKDITDNTFFNINTIQDYEKAKKLFISKKEVMI